MYMMMYYTVYILNLERNYENYYRTYLGRTYTDTMLCDTPQAYYIHILVHMHTLDTPALCFS